MKSIRRWLLGWLICGLGAACIVAGAGIFHLAQLESGELFDYANCVRWRCRCRSTSAHPMSPKDAAMI